MEQLKLFVERKELFNLLITRRTTEIWFQELTNCRLYKPGHNNSQIMQRARSLISMDRGLMVAQHDFDSKQRNSI